MKQNIISVFKESGNCEIRIDEVVKQWDNRCLLMRWKDEFRIVEEVWYRGKNTGKTKFKLNISQADAYNLILKLNLVEQQSFLKSGKTYRTEASEANHVIVEMMAYIKIANKKIRELNKKLKSKCTD